MKKTTMLFILGLALGAQTVYAAEKNGGTKTFWESLRARIEAMTPQKKLGLTTATGGVRGAPVSTSDMYWKNEATGETVPAEELEEFKKAMKLAESSDKAQAHAAFAEFIKKHPGSPLRKDADQALALLGNNSKTDK